MTDSSTEEAFIRTIIEDVAAAIHRADQSKTDESRRSAIRTICAAIEGMVWEYRDNVVWAATEIDVMVDIDRQALFEAMQTIDAQGNLRSQPRFIPTLNLLRFMARLAERVTSSGKIAFDDNHWGMLNDAVRLRNRITHPKNASDVIITGSDVDRAFTAFNWMCDQIIQSSEAMVGAISDQTAKLWYILSKLRDEDPFYMAEYRRIQGSLD
jgi:hypothetical protein